MILDQILALGFYGIFFFAGIAFLYQRLRWRRRRRQGKPSLGFYPRGTALGNAFQQLQIIAEPQMTYVLEEKLNEDEDDEDSGGPDDPTRHLHRQAARIRRGETIDTLTALLPKPD